MTQPTVTPRSFPLSRRGLLGGATAGAALAGLGAGLDPVDAEIAAGFHGRGGHLPRKVDVVVVGAGIAGLVAARNAARAGLDVLLVEARDRVGGRVLNHHLTTSHTTIESGGAFIGPTQDHLAALAKEYKVATFAEYNTGMSTYISSTIGKLEYPGTVPPDPTLAEALVVIQQLDNDAATIDVAAPWAHPKAKEWDAMTFYDFIKANAPGNTEGVARLTECWAEPGFGSDPKRMSYLYTAWYCACSGNEKNTGSFDRNSNTADGAQERRFVPGSQLVPLRIAKHLGDIVALNAPVHRIEQKHHQVVVHTARGVVHARRAIVAAPPPLVLDIDWYPHLPTRRHKLLSSIPMGQLMKCDAVYKTPFWRKNGVNGFGISDHGAARAVFDNSPADGSPGVLLAFMGGDTWRHYGRMPLAKRRQAVLEGFAEMFGDEALHPIEYVEHDWTKERWSGGGPTAVHNVGSLTKYGPVIRQPFGLVHWAGTETGTYWTGYMDGAARSGQRAAIEVIDQLKHRHHR